MGSLLTAVQEAQQERHARAARSLLGTLAVDLRAASQDAAKALRDLGLPCRFERTRPRYSGTSSIPVQPFRIRVPGLGVVTFDSARVAGAVAVLRLVAERVPEPDLEGVEGVSLVEPAPFGRARIVVSHDATARLEIGGSTTDTYELTEDRPNGGRGLPLEDARALVGAVVEKLNGLRLVEDPE